MTLLCHVSSYVQPGKGAGELPQSAPPEFPTGLCPGIPTRHGTTATNIKHRAGCYKQATASLSARICTRSLVTIMHPRCVRRRHQQAMVRRKQTPEV